MLDEPLRVTRRILSGLNCLIAVMPPPAASLLIRPVGVERIDARVVGLPMLDRMFKEHKPGEAPEAMAALAGRLIPAG